jgi:hypothetical protein
VGGRGALLVLFLTLGLGWGQAAAKSLCRGPRAFNRDVARLANVPKVTSLSDLLDSRSAFTRSLVPKGEASWRSYDEGTKRFRVDLGKGTAVEGEAYKIRLPMVTATKLNDLKLVMGSRTRSLMPRSGVTISLDHDTAYYYSHDKGDLGRVVWHGPESRFALLSLLHELGHVKDMASITERQRQEMRQIYDLKTEDKPLSNVQLRKMVGFERSGWAHALRQARQLRRVGFDILGKTPTREIRQVIDGCLKNYYEYTGNP